MRGSSAALMVACGGFLAAAAQWLGYLGSPLRPIRYDVASGRSSILLRGLQFANGAALGLGDAFVLLAESGAYRVRRLWPSGPNVERIDTFADNLPGLPT